MTVVDRDRQAVYDLEDVALGGTTFDDVLAFTDAAALVADFCAGRFWHELGLPAPVVRRTRRDSQTSYARCDADGASIHLSPGGCTVAVVTHELAHVLVAHTRDGSTPHEPDHGPAFRQADVRLADALMGAVAAERLAAAFDAAGLALGPARDGVPRAGGVGFALGWWARRAAPATGVSQGRPPIAL